MALIVKNKNREWMEEDTIEIQLESLKQFAKVLGYKLKDSELSVKGFVRDRYSYIGLHAKTNNISFKDMINLHNFVKKDMIENNRDYFCINSGYLKNIKTLPTRLRLDNEMIFNDHILFLKMINYSYSAKLVEKVKLQKNKNYDLKVQAVSNIVKIVNKGNEYLKENDYLFRKEDIIIDTKDNSSNKIKDVELYRDGGSFSFEYKETEYEVFIPLYIVTNKNGIVNDIDLITKICDSFHDNLLKNPITKDRIYQVFRYLRTLKAIKVGHL